MDLLRTRWSDSDTALCVGLDPDLERIPKTALRGSRPLLDFCCAIVDATADAVCAFKPQAAHFAALGLEVDLAELIAYIHARHPQIPVILDAKRGDIGATARLYATEAFLRYGADAVTVSPYLGFESIEPYFDYPERGVIVLCRTSNPDSAWLQNYPEEDPVFLRVARGVAEWNRHGNLMLVAGATYAGDLGRIRSLVGDMPLLVPGVGAQGGDLGAVLQAGLDSNGRGLVINASRTVLYADPGPDYAMASETAARTLRDDIRRLQSEVAPHGAMV